MNILARAAFALCLFATSSMIYGQAKCFNDVNQDGDLTEFGETADCLTAAGGGSLCPLQAEPCEPAGPAICPPTGASCGSETTCSTTVTGNCTEFGSMADGTPRYRCDVNPEITGSAEFCGRSCSLTEVHQCRASQPSCPLGGSFSCVDVEGYGQPMCSPNTCSTDLQITDLTRPSSSMLIDDGERNEAGVCLNETRIFSGRALSCRTPGAVSAWKNCCGDTDGKIYHDSVGNTVEATLTSKALVATAAASYAAASAYASALSAGSTAGAAADAGGQAFVNSLQGAFDPTSLAIAVAIALVTAWLASACDQESIEAATLLQSEYCIPIGEKCVQEWLGSCVQRVQVNCCYNSKLARMVNEQGLSQLAGYDPEQMMNVDNPQCGGFSPEQLQALDFSKIDFTEYYDEINSQITDKLPEAGPPAVEEFYR